MTARLAPWSDGRTAVGAWLSLREPLLAEQAARCGYDYVCIDMQHGFSEYGDVKVLLHALSAGDTVPIVRVPWNEPSVIGRVLDAGALGVIVPLINDADQARKVVDASRYPPLGQRSFGPVAARIRHGGDYFEQADERTICLPMIETAVAVENVDAILSVPGVDGVYLGPVDLSVSMGLGPSPDIDRPEIAGALAAVLAACARHGKIAGIHAGPEQIADRTRRGYRMVTVAGDVAPALNAIRDSIASARTALADHEPTEDSIPPETEQR